MKKLMESRIREVSNVNMKSFGRVRASLLIARNESNEQTRCDRRHEEGMTCSACSCLTGRGIETIEVEDTSSSEEDSNLEINLGRRGMQNGRMEMNSGNQAMQNCATPSSGRVTVPRRRRRQRRRMSSDGNSI